MARVLVVDDAPHITYIIALFLRQRGHEVTCAGDGQAALEFLRTQVFDVLITDVDMPRIGGLSLIGDRDAVDGLCGIVVLTARNDYGTIALDKNRHNVRIMPKPFSPNSIVETIEEFMSACLAGAGADVR